MADTTLTIKRPGTTDIEIPLVDNGDGTHSPRVNVQANIDLDIEAADIGTAVGDDLRAGASIPTDEQTATPAAIAAALVNLATETRKYTAAASGELAGSATALQMPTIACSLVMFKAVWSNAGNVYIGGAGVTKVNGTTDTTTGFELAAGESTPWLPTDNLDTFYRICDNAGDDLTYIALA